MKTTYLFRSNSCPARRRSTAVLAAIFCVYALVGPAVPDVHAGKNMRMARKYEKAGQFALATDSYYDAVMKSGSAKARLGLQKSSERALAESLDRFDAAFGAEQYSRSFDQLQRVEGLETKVAQAGVSLEVPVAHREKFATVRNTLAEKHYEAGRSAFDAADWETAAKEFEAIRRYSRTFKDSRNYLARAVDHRDTARADAAYDRGLRFAESGDYRQAFAEFDEALSHKADFRDAASRKHDALDRGRVRIGVFPMHNASGLSGLESKVYAHLISSAVKHPDPFLQVVDRQHLDRLMAEQRLAASGVVDSATAAQAGKILGLDVVVLATVVDAGRHATGLSSTSVPAFEKYSYRDSEGKVRWDGRKTTFLLHEDSCETWLDVQYKIVSPETGEILRSDVHRVSRSHAVKYATYRGDYSKLTLHPPETYDSIVKFALVAAVLGGDVDKGLFTANKKLPSVSSVASDLARESGTKLSSAICNAAVSL